LIASEVAATQKNENSPNTPSSLPACFDSATDLETVKSSIKANSSNAHKYNSYRQLLQNSTDEELLARLTYSETRAANCPQKNEAINSAIATVIGNRIKIRKGDVKSVVFQRDQFASSLNIYSESKYLDFLCPKDAELWNSSLKHASESLKKTQHTNTVNYFLYKHSPRWTKEPWKLELDSELTTQEIKDCIHFFKSPQFK
jgi:hypothetical protein